MALHEHRNCWKKDLEKIILYFLPVLAYALGSIPSGLLLTRLSGHGDIRKSGSGNIGAANVQRTAGTCLALITLAGDAAKGAFPVWFAASFVTGSRIGIDLFPCIVALSAFLGHLFPAYLKFREGGKGVAVAAGCFLVLAPSALAASAAVFTLVLLRFNQVSAGSLSGAGALPIAVWISTRSVAATLCALAFSGLIFLRHKDNIRRLMAGTEAKFR